MTPSAPSAEAGETVALGKLDAVKTGDTVSSGKTAPSRWSSVEPIAAGAGDGDRGSRPQGRRQARPGLVAAERGRSLADHDPQSRKPTTSCCGGRARCICGWRWNGCAIASASTSNRIRRRSDIRRPSANRSASAAGTRSSPAATASSATWCWRSSRCRAAAVSSSTKRSSAARCRATISARWRRAWSTDWRAGRSAFPSSMCR